jgi:predicted amidohydrolase YtcJ
VAEPGVTVGATKIFLDGIVQFPAQTAYMSSAYLGADGKPRTDDHARGELYVEGPMFNTFVAEAGRRGWQSHIHAIGDGAVTTALDAFEYAREENPRIRSHPTIAHAERQNRAL